MSSPRSRRLAPVVLALSLAVSLGAEAATQKPPLNKEEGAAVTEANITRLTASLLERSQFAHHPLDDEFAGKFLERYLDSLDGTRSLFLQSDVKELAAIRSKLAQATRDAGDTAPAHTVFRRYLERLTQRSAFVTSLLRAGKFDFTGHDSFVLDRENAARPADLAAAQELWRQQTRAEYLQEKLADKPAAQIVSTLSRRNEQQLRTMKLLRGDDIIEIYLNALAHVYDPHSDYLGHEQMESLSISMNLSLFGIGASLQTEDGYCTIRELLPGGPAARSGLFKPGDRIIAVAQAKNEPVDIVNMPLSRAVELIRGPKGTVVRLTIIPAGSPDGAMSRTISLVRDEIKLADQQAKARIIDLPVGKTGAGTVRVGVVDLPSFYADMGGDNGRSARRSATADVARLLAKLKAEKVRGVVLDLRKNGGGSLEEAISLTGLFIRKGPVVQTRGPAGDIEVDADSDGAVAYDGPLVVATSRFSASASEILVGALQDYGRAVVVGDSSTFGKGTVQNVLPLARVMDQTGLAYSYDPGALKVTIRKFYRPDGASTQLRGVSSNIVLPSTSDLTDIGESALKDPLPWDTVKASAHERLNRVEPYVAALRRESAKRVAVDRSFAYVTEDVARLKKSLAAKSVSLNEAERRQELAEAKARRAEREKERSKTRDSQQYPTYAITLENAGAPGLPPAIVFPKPEQKKDEKGESDAKSGKKNDKPLAAVPVPGEELEDGPAPPTGRPLPDDPTLHESVRILIDYAELLSRPTGATAGTSAVSVPAPAAAPPSKIAPQPTKQAPAAAH